MPCSIEGTSLPIILGCPADNELFFVSGAIGGSGAGLYGWRRWVDIKHCIVGTVIPPYVGIVDGGVNNPVSGISTFQSNSLIGLGSANNGNIQIVYAEILRSNFGDNASINYDPITGTIDL